MKKPRIGISAAFAIGIAVGVVFATQGIALVSTAVAREPGAGEPLISTTAARERNFYAPNCETLPPDEMRVIACGTGMPTPRPAQAAACFLVELGNGEKFLFDIGSGSVERLFGLQIPTAFLDKVFIGHLHGDHFGGIGELYVAGGIAGRFTPLRILGAQRTPARTRHKGGHRSHAKDADLVVHECFIAAPDLAEGPGYNYGRTPEAALQAGTQIHTAPEAFGKVMSTLKPRMVVAYHFWTGMDSTPGVLERIRTTYDGPLSLAEDYVTWNVTRDDIRVRKGIIDDESWNPPAAYPAESVLASDRVGCSPEIEAGRWDVDDVIRPIDEEAEKALARKFPYPND